MKLLNKKIDPGIFSDKAAGAIANTILKVQNGFGNRMQTLSQNWQQKQKWIFFYMVSLVLGGLSVLVIATAFKEDDKPAMINLNTLKVPQTINSSKDKLIITQKEFKQVQEYKATHPDLAKERPGLFDSLTKVEEMYYSQSK